MTRCGRGDDPAGEADDSGRTYTPGSAVPGRRLRGAGARPSIEEWAASRRTRWQPEDETGAAPLAPPARETHVSATAPGDEGSWSAAERHGSGFNPARPVAPPEEPGVTELAPVDLSKHPAAVPLDVTDPHGISVSDVHQAIATGGAAARAWQPRRPTPPAVPVADSWSGRPSVLSGDVAPAGYSTRFKLTVAAAVVGVLAVGTGAAMVVTSHTDNESVIATQVGTRAAASTDGTTGPTGTRSSAARGKQSAAAGTTSGGGGAAAGGGAAVGGAVTGGDGLTGGYTGTGGGYYTGGGGYTGGGTGTGGGGGTTGGGGTGGGTGTGGGGGTGTGGTGGGGTGTGGGGTGTGGGGTTAPPPTTPPVIAPTTPPVVIPPPTTPKPPVTSPPVVDPPTTTKPPVSSPTVTPTKTPRA